MLHGRFSWSKKEEADLRQCEQAGRVHTTSESCQKLGLGSSLLSLSSSSQVYNVWVLPRASGTCLLPFRAVWLRSFDLASLQMWLGLSSHPSYFCRQNESPQPSLNSEWSPPSFPSHLGFPRAGFLDLPQPLYHSRQAGRQASRRTGLGTAVYICLSPCLICLHLCVAILTLPGGAFPRGSGGVGGIK